MRKRKLFLIVVISLLWISPALAHKEANSAGFWPYFTAKQEFTVYGDAAMNSGVVIALKPGADISLRDYGTPAKIGDVWGNWYSVMYVQGNDYGSGYIWSGEGLSNESLKYGEQSFIYEVAPDMDNYLAAVTLKAFDKNGKLLSQSPGVTVGLEVANNIYLRSLDADGLENVDFIAQLYMTAEACGFPSYELYYAWTDNKLVVLPEAITMGGEGIYTSFAENVIFPAGGAPYNIIVKVVSSFEPLDEDSYLTKDDFATEVYRWDGKQAVLIKQDPAILDWRKAEQGE